MLNIVRIFPVLLLWATLASVSFLDVEVVCAQKSEPTVKLTPEERTWLGAHPDIQLAYTDAFEPEVITNPDGTYSGMVVDFLDALNKKLGTDFGLRIYKIPQLIEKAKTKEVDGILNLHPQYVDKLGLLKTRTYWPGYPAVFARRGVFFDNPDDFKGKRVAITDQVYFTEKLIQQYGEQATIVKVKNGLEGLQSVAKGDADYFLGASFESYFITKYQLLGIVPAYVFVDSPVMFGIGIRPDWPQLVSILNKGITLFSEEEIHAIISKWSYLPKKPDTVELTPEERAWLKAHPNIQLGYTDEYEPEVIVNPDGTYRGILIDFLAELNRRLGTRIDLHFDSTPGILEKAKTKAVDGILEIHPEYADKLGLLKSAGYLTTYPAVFARRDVSFEGPDDFAGKRVAIIDKVYFSEKLVRQYGEQATILKVKDAEQGMKVVSAGDADLFIGVSFNSYLLTKYQLFDVVAKYTFLDYPDKFGMAIRPDWPDLIPILNKGISSFSQNEIDAIVAKWVHLPQPKDVIALTPKEQAWLAQNHTVRVFSTDHAPLMSFKGGKPFGISADLLNEVSERTGIKFDIVKPLRDFPSALKGLTDRDGPDLMAGLNPTPKREKVILFTKPYVSSPKFIFTRDDAGFVSSMANLSGKTVAVIGGYVTHKLLAENYPDINLLTYKKNEEALRAVSSEEAFAFIGSLLATSSMINEFGLTNLKASAPSALPDATVAMGIRNDWPELRNMINKVFDAVPEGEKTAIINKWSSVKIEYGIRPADVLKWALVVGGSAFGILLLFVFWNWSLRRQVHLRTAELDSSIQSLRAEIGERKQAEGERDRILDSSHDLICIASMDGYFKYVNPAWEKTLGYTQDELLNKPFQDFIHPDDHTENDAEVEKLTAGQQTLDFENRYIHKDGTVRHLSWVATPLLEERAIYCIGRDITQRKEREQKIMEYQGHLKALASQLTVAEERERRTLAADLHDHVGHSLALARMQLNGILEAQSELERTMLVKDISHILLKSLQDTRSLIFELSSPSLNEIGLGAAVSEWLEEHLGKRYGLKTELIDEIDEKYRKTLDDNVRAVLFRNVRELLTNVIKHAKAEKVSVYLKNDDTMLTVIIEDDGAGFDPQAATPPGEEKSGFGLFSIRERMADLSGSFDIQSEPGKGLKAVLTVPLDKGGLE